MTEQEYLKHKIPILIKEGYSKQQSTAIAYNMFKTHKKMQEGGFFDYENQTYDNPYFGQLQKPPADYAIEAPPPLNSTTFTPSPQYNREVIGDYPTEKVASNKNPNYNTEIFNPFGGVSLEQSLFSLGQGIGEKDPFKTAVGAGLSGLKLARIGMSGYATGKEDRRVQDEFYKNLYKDNRPVSYLQEGGKITNSEVMTGKYIVDQKQGNVELEDGEHVKDNTTGNVQKVVGDSHLEGGVKTTLKDAKVLSDYTKIGAKNAKELKERYQISIKASDTFAKVMDKVNKKIGVDKATEELTGYIEKVGENESVKSKATKKLNEEYLTKEIEEYQNKLDELSGAQNAVFEDLFDRQEAIPKKAEKGQILDDKGEVVQDRGKEDVSQQGGRIVEIASKYGISPGRAMELVKMQEGGEMSQEEQGELSPEQIVQAYAQATGQDPQAIVQQLQAMQPQEQQQALMQMSQSLQEVAQQGGEYNFSTRYTPKVEGYTVEGSSVLPQDTLMGVEPIQKYTGKGYGAKMADVDKFISTHSWYFDSEDKKNKFKEAVKKEGKQQEITDFQNAYNKELLKRADKVNIPQEEKDRIVKELGFTGSGVQKYDGLFGAFTSTRPLVDFKKSDGAVKVEVKPVDVYKAEDTATTIAQERGTKMVMPQLPSDFILPPSAMQPISKPYVPFGKIEPIKQTTEPYLAEQERQRQTDVARIEQTGMSPQQQEALLAQGLSSSQMASNDAISKVEGFNADSQMKADQFNLNQTTKEALTNAQFNMDYQDKMMRTLANQESAMRRYYNALNERNRQNFMDVRDLNTLNAGYDKFQTDGSNITFVPNYSEKVKEDPNFKSWWDNATPQQRIEYMKQNS